MDGQVLLSVDGDVLDTVPLERLEEEISGFASRIASATATWLLWIAAYDRRRGWTSWGVKSCAHWLNWQCGMSPRTAREHVSVARTLETTRLLRQTFLDGELSFSKVRAICRVVAPENEEELVRIAKISTASQLDRIVGKMPNNKPDDADDHPFDVTYSANGDGTMTMTITADAADILQAKKAVQLASAAVIDRELVDGESKSDTIERLGGMKQIRSTTTCQVLTGTIDAPRNVIESALVVAEIDTLAGVDPEGEATVDNVRVDPAVVQRLCCDAKIQTALMNGGQEVGLGSEQRIVPRALRRLLLRRDHGMCQFPGCESEHRLHAHHIIHWAKGGPTELANLISVCDFHHHKLHEGGWNIEVTDRGFVFVDPAGTRHLVPVLRLPTRQPLNRRNGAAAPLAGLGERANLNYIADLLISNTASRQERLSQLG